MRLRAAVMALCLSGCGAEAGHQSRAQEYQQHFGVAFYALLADNFPCREALDAFQGLPEAHLSILWGTFGDNLDCLQRFDALPNAASIQIHMTNETCRRAPRKCHEGEILPKFSIDDYNSALEDKDPMILSVLVSRLAQIRNATAGLKSRIIITLGLESNYSDAAALNIYDVIRNLFKGEIVYNPVSGGPIPGPLFELHHAGVCGPGSTYNNDGLDALWAAREPGTPSFFSGQSLREIMLGNLQSGCEYQYIWLAPSQGLHGQRDFVRPRDRNFRVHSEDIRGVNLLLKELYEQTT